MKKSNRKKPPALPIFSSVNAVSIAEVESTTKARELFTSDIFRISVPRNTHASVSESIQFFELQTASGMFFSEQAFNENKKQCFQLLKQAALTKRIFLKGSHALMFYRSSGANSFAPGTWFPTTGYLQEEEMITKPSTNNAHGIRLSKNAWYESALMNRFGNFYTLLFSAIVGGGFWEERSNILLIDESLVRTNEKKSISPFHFRLKILEHFGFSECFSLNIPCIMSFYREYQYQIASGSILKEEEQEAKILSQARNHTRLAYSECYTAKDCTLTLDTDVFEAQYCIGNRFHLLDKPVRDAQACAYRSIVFGAEDLCTMLTQIAAHDRPQEAAVMRCK